MALLMGLGGAVAAVAAPVRQADPPPVTCALRVPANPLTARGLATAYQLVGVGGTTCHEEDPGTAAFVQGLILDPATGQLSTYDPLVVDAGTRPAVAPVVPALPAHAVVGIWFGFNGDELGLEGRGTGAGACVTGTKGSPFGQFSYCNAPAFFKAANADIAAGMTTVPPIGTAKDGEACPTTRDFGLVDQDQSDNVTTTYLVLPSGRTAQNTSTAARQLQRSHQSPQVLSNGSDNLLLDAFIDPALGCTPWTAPNLADGGRPVTSLGLNELQAAADQDSPVALVPLNDPMTLNNTGDYSTAKTDLYRAGVDQVALSRASGSPTAYCSDIRRVGGQRDALDEPLTSTFGSPDSSATNLYLFMAERLQASYVNLNCRRLIGEPNPVTTVTNSAGVVVAASFDLGGTGASPSPTHSASSAPSHSASPSPSAAAPTRPAAPTTPPAQPSSAAGTLAPPRQAVQSSTAQPSTAATAPSTAPPATQTPAAAAPTGSAGAAATGSTPAAPGTGTASAVANGQVPTPTASSGELATFDQGFATLSAASARSALSGPNPLQNTGTNIMDSRVVWAIGGAFIVLCLSLLLWRPKRR